MSDVENESELPLGQHIYGRPDIWPNFARMYEGYVAEPSQQQMQQGWRSSYAAVAYFAGKYDVARSQLESLQWKPWSGNLSGWGRDLSLMALEVAARTGAAGPQVATAEANYRRANVEKAIELFRQIEVLPALDERTSQFVKSRLAILDLEKQLATGQWVNFMPSSTNDPAWSFPVGNFQRAPDGTLEIHADKFGHMLFNRARSGMNFEVRGEFEIVKSTSDDFQAGLVMGLPDFNAMDWYAFRMKRNAEEGDVASFSRAWTRQQVSSPATLNRGRNSFEFRYQNRQATASVNGKTVLRQSAPPKSSARISPTEFFFGLGAYNDMNETVLRYKDVQIRRLSGGIEEQP